MKFVTIRYNSGEVYKINLEQVHHIEIYNKKIQFNFGEHWVTANKDGTLNFNEVKEVAENL